MDKQDAFNTGPLNFSPDALAQEAMRAQDKLRAGLDTLRDVDDVDYGVTAKEEVWRDGKVSRIPATLGAMDTVASAAPAGRDNGADTGPKLGLTVSPVQAEAGAAGSSSKDGLVVQQSNGPAAQAGVRPGDVLLAVNGAKVGTVEDVRKALKEADKAVALLVQRGEARIFIPVPLG